MQKKIWRGAALAVLLALCWPGITARADAEDGANVQAGKDTSVETGAEEAQNEEEQQAAEEMLLEGTFDVIDELDLSGLSDLYESASDAFGGADLEEAIQNLSEEGLTDFSVEQVLNAVWKALKERLLGNWKVAAEIIAILLLMGILKNMQSSFGQGGVSEAATWAGYIMVALLASLLLLECMRTTRSAIETLGSGMEALTPILMLLLTGMGGLSTSAVLSPVMAALTGGIFTLVDLFIFPAILAGAVLSLTAGVTSTLRLEALPKLIESGVKWLLGILFVVFLGITTLKGLTGASLDGVYFKTAKYTVDKMVPVIGGMFSDTLDTVMACSLIVKNAVGIVGLVALSCAIGVPLLSLLADMLLLRLAAAAADLFADEAASRLLTSISSTVLLLFLTLLTLLAMVFIYIAMVMGAADVSAMVR